MPKKLVIALMLASCLLLLSSCSKEEKIISNKEVLDVGEYMSSLSAEKVVHLETRTNLLLHPLKDAIELYGNDYELSWKGNYVKLKFNDAKCSFEAYIGAEFEHYDWYNNYVDYNDCNVMEYLSFAVIERVILMARVCP